MRVNDHVPVDRDGLNERSSISDHSTSAPGTSTPDPALNGHRPLSLIDTIPDEYRGQFLLTEAANGLRFAQQFGGRFRYVAQWGRWLWWDGRRWVEDQEGRSWEAARSVASSIYDEAAEVAERGEKGYAKQLADFADRSLSDHGLRAMLHQAETWEGIAATPEQFDSHAWLLNARNGVLDLRTGKLGPHDPALLLTKLVDIDYDPAAKLPRRFLRFLLEIFRHNKRLVRFLQRAIGYSLVADVSGECFLILYGTGHNGKSTLILVLRDLLGSYAINVKPEVLAYQRYQSATAPTPDVARLRGMRLVTSVETGEGVWLNESLLKQFASREPMTARFLHGQPFDFPPTFTLWISTNHKPNIRGTDLGIWRRVVLVPFERAFAEGERDEHLIDKLRAELVGILAWAVRGCLAWQREGMGAPPEVTAATASYREEMDVLHAFLDECCDQSPTARVTNKELYAAYSLWCQANSERPVRSRDLVRRLEERGLTAERDRTRSVSWPGLGLRPEVVKDLEDAERRKSGKGGQGGGRFSSDTSDPPKTTELPQRFVSQANGPAIERWRPCPSCNAPTWPPDFRCAACGPSSWDTAQQQTQTEPQMASAEPAPDYCPDCGGPPREGVRDYGDGPRCELHDRLLARREGGRL